MLVVEIFRIICIIGEKLEGMEEQERVKKGKYTFRGEAWFNVSPEAKDLISNMLRMTPSERLSAEGCLAHS